MKILTAEQFLKEPYGTVYIHYKPCVFIGEPKIKSEPRGDKSWWTISVLPWVTADSDSEVNDELNKGLEYSYYEIETEEFCTDDAIYNYDKDMLYAVFNKDEVKRMIDRLIESLYLYEIC